MGGVLSGLAAPWGGGGGTVGIGRRCVLLALCGTLSGLSVALLQLPLEDPHSELSSSILSLQPEPEVPPELPPPRLRCC